MYQEDNKKYSLVVSDLCKNYRRKTILKNINFELHSGHILGVLGPNGAGKSTLLRIIAGLETQDSGNIEFEDYIELNEHTQDIKVLSKKLNNTQKKISKDAQVLRKSRISFLPSYDFLIEDITVKDNILWFSKFFDDFDQLLCEEYLLNMKVDLNTKIKALSQGFKVRIQTAFILARKALIYILDEPFDSLDPIAKDYVKGLVTKLAYDATMIIATQEIDILDKYFDDVIFLDFGKVILSGSAEVIRYEKSGNLSEVYKEIMG